MIEVGDQLTCRLSAGGTLTVEVEDRVLSDRSAGQYENGWWVAAAEADEEWADERGYFLSEEGVLWGHTPNETSWRSLFQTAIGYYVPLKRVSRNFDLMIEAMADGTFKCGTVCTCQQISKPVEGCPLHGHQFR